MTSALDTVSTIFKKEMREHFRTKRLVVIGAIFALVFIVISLYGGILSGRGGSEPTFKAGANSVLGMVLTFTSFFPGLMAIVMSYTAIAGERSRKSLILILSKPVKRPAVFLGKFLSSYLAIVLVYLVVMTTGYICVVAASGRVPSAEEVARAYGAVGFVLMAMACWVSFAMFLSTALKNPMTVVVTAIMVWFLIMPIVSSVGMIYWMVTAPTGESPLNGVGAALLPAPGQGATVILTGAPSTEFSVYNDTVRLEGQKIMGSYTLSSVPEGSYWWSARGGGVSRNGTIAVHTSHGFIVSFERDLRVSVPPGVNVTLERGGEAIPPHDRREEGGVVNYTFSGELGECRLTITADGHVLFTGGYLLAGSFQETFGGLAGANTPDYVKYNQLINPDYAMMGYEQLLNPGSSTATRISPAEGAGAMLAFFLAFTALGLVLFSRAEMT